MPVYLYRCKACGCKVTLVVTEASKDDSRPCTRCGGRLERQPDHRALVAWQGRG
jgi:putative FmdB family regulatory protein